MRRLRSSIGRRLSAACGKVPRSPSGKAASGPRIFLVGHLSLWRLSLAAMVVPAMFVAATARGQDRVAFGLDWKAEAEYGGYYQALATGLYAKRGLDVTIEEGGPQVNHMLLLMAGRLDFNLGGGRAIEFAAAESAVSRRRGDLSERSRGADRSSRPGKRQLRGAEGQADHDRRRRAHRLVAFSRRQNSAMTTARSGPILLTWGRFLPTRRRSKKATPAASLF